MIKKIVFDLDNTLIMWDEKYWSSIDKTIKELNILDNEEFILEFKKQLLLAIREYENVYDKYNIESMKKIIEEYTNMVLPDNFIEVWIKYLSLCTPDILDDELFDTLAYLKNKYKLVVLTNWFTKQQKARLDKANILSYFDEVIGTDLPNILNKPNKEAFLLTCKPYNFDECLMIGDNIKVDIEGALNVGMDAILYDYKHNYDGKYKKIDNIKELKKIL